MRIIPDMEPKPLGEAKHGEYLRTYYGAPPKYGKTTTSLSLWFGRAGHVVSKPENLIILRLDQDGTKYLKKTAVEAGLNEPEVSRVGQYDLEREAVGEVNPTPDGSFPLNERINKIISYLGMKLEEAKDEVFAIWIASVPALARGIQREIRYGDLNKSAKDHMDRDRWHTYGIHLSDIRSRIHALPAHIIWEFQIARYSIGEKSKDVSLVQGSQDGLWASDCSQGIQLCLDLSGRRFFNTRPDWDQMKTCRGEADLESNEPADFSVICKKLGLRMAT